VGVYWKKDEEARSGWAYLYHWRNTAGGDSTRIFFPLYWHFYRSPDWSVDVFFPFYTRYRDGDTSITAIPPVVLRRSPDRDTWSLFFLYWRDRQKDSGSTSFMPLFYSGYNPGGGCFSRPCPGRAGAP